MTQTDNDHISNIGKKNAKDSTKVNVLLEWDAGLIIAVWSVENLGMVQSGQNNQNNSPSSSGATVTTTQTNNNNTQTSATSSMHR